MYLSAAEREMVMAMRAAVEAEVRTLTHWLEQADAVQSELINKTSILRQRIGN